MANWHYNPNTVEEAPFAWNALHERYRIPRGISVMETPPGSGNYEEIRFYAYTDETGAENLPRDTAYQSQEFYKDIKVFRGGYIHTVDDQTRTDLINSGVATAANFTAI